MMMVMVMMMLMMVKIMMMKIFMRMVWYGKLWYGMMLIVMRTMRGKLTLCAQETPSTSFIVLDPKDLKELGRWGNYNDFEY